MLEHGPWVARSRKLTKERSLFLSIICMVCGNIIPGWFHGRQGPHRPHGRIEHFVLNFANFAKPFAFKSPT